MAMVDNGYRAGVPDDWFVDPIRLGVPGVRQHVADPDENPLAWQSDSLCENDERFGIWGGLSERERRKLRKRA